MTCRPEKETEENTKYYYYLSKVHIQSEHCMGFLKGHWSLLWGLSVKIHDEEGVHYAALWIIACIHLHAFSLDHEDNEFITKAQFYKEGHKIMQREQHHRNRERENKDKIGVMEADNEDEDIELLEGKLRWEELKKGLFTWIDSCE